MSLPLAFPFSGESRSPGAGQLCTRSGFRLSPEDLVASGQPVRVALDKLRLSGVRGMPAPASPPRYTLRQDFMKMSATFATRSERQEYS
jgi:hypothetical protein